jgi:hypothetical protein
MLAGASRHTRNGNYVDTYMIKTMQLKKTKKKLKKNCSTIQNRGIQLPASPPALILILNRRKTKRKIEVKMEAEKELKTF